MGAAQQSRGQRSIMPACLAYRSDNKALGLSIQYIMRLWPCEAVRAALVNARLGVVSMPARVGSGSVRG